MKKFFLILIFLSLTSFADLFDNPSQLKQITENMPNLESIKCKFKQEKILKNIQKPIVSSGDFEFINKKGVYFKTKFPIESSTDYTSDKYKQINDIVNAISNKKYSKLENDFNFYFVGNKSNWNLGLKPKKNSQSYNYITSITIKGTDFINQICINQKNGNKTTIWFTK